MTFTLLTVSMSLMIGIVLLNDVDGPVLLLAFLLTQDCVTFEEDDGKGRITAKIL